MTFTASYNPSNQIIEVDIQGELTIEIIKQISVEAFRIASEQNCRLILTDLNRAVIRLSFLDIYQLPTLFSETARSAGLDIHEFKRAFVAPTRLRDLMFFETVLLNRSQNVRHFYEVDAARAWLSGDDSRGW
ncbi:MAG: hypothetical protein EPO32_03065 [Anaerolineae bacterium]|nr:MAG: hypothetical protein EPO32_03065 [Anaerolineae bacterium]